MPGSDQKTDRSRKRVRLGNSCTAALKSSNCASAKSDVIDSAVVDWFGATT